MECMCTLTGLQHQMKPHTANTRQAVVLYRTGRWQCAAPFLDHLSAVETDRMQFPERRKPGVGAMHIKGSHEISETRALPVLYTSHHLCFSSLDGQMVGHGNIKTFTTDTERQKSTDQRMGDVWESLMSVTVQQHMNCVYGQLVDKTCKELASKFELKLIIFTSLSYGIFTGIGIKLNMKSKFTIYLFCIVFKIWVQSLRRRSNWFSTIQQK